MSLNCSLCLACEATVFYHARPVLNVKELRLCYVRMDESTTHTLVLPDIATDIATDITTASATISALASL